MLITTSSGGGTASANQPLVTLLALTLSLLLIAIAHVECNPGPNFSDCMKNPFASGCRGISAKRSVGGAGGGEQSPSSQLLEPMLMGEPDLSEPSGAALRHWLEALKLRAKLESGSSGNNFVAARQRPMATNQQQPFIELVQIFINDQPAASRERTRQRDA